MTINNLPFNGKKRIKEKETGMNTQPSINLVITPLQSVSFSIVWHG